MAFNPRQRSQIYVQFSNRILTQAPLTSSQLGEVIDNIAFANADTVYQFYVEATNALALLKLENTAGNDLDVLASQYPDLVPRFQSVRATGQVTVTDPSITKIDDVIAGGGANDGDAFLNLVDASTFPTAGTVLVGDRNGVVFESFTYTSKSGNQLVSTTDTLLYDHGSGETVVKTTVGDRTFPGPFSVSTEATAQEAAKTYSTSTPIVIYDGEESGICDISADATGTIGNTSAGTIAKFIGTPPFAGAAVTNGANITTGVDLELDVSLRDRIRRYVQSLSTGNIDSISNTLTTKASFEGTIVKTVLEYEEPDPTLPSILYIDDGTGFTPTQASLSSPLTLIPSAIGQESHVRIPMDYLPIVTTPLENAAKVYANAVIYKNASPYTQGTAPNQCFIHPDNGMVKFNTPLATGDQIQLFTATYYTGLVQEANKQLYGDRFDRTTYKGVLAFGSWVQVRVPSTQFITIVGSFILDTTRTPNEVFNEVRQDMLKYVNELGVGASVIRNKLAAMGFVKGVRDFDLITPAVDIIIPPATLAKTTLSNITLS
jgi:hypothetical protein